MPPVTQRLSNQNELHTVSNTDATKRTSNPDAALSRVFVIGGMPRSGTNLARRLIGSHSQVAIPPVEFHYHPVVEDLVHLHSDLVYQQLLARYTALKGKSIAGEKSPLNEFYYRDIRRCLADSDLRFIHMVRNPFDVVASYKNAPFRGVSANNDVPKLATIAREWVRSVSLATARTLVQSDSYRMIRFEDLTSDTATVTASLCTFLGLEFERERMLSLADYQGQPDNTSFTAQRSSCSDMEPAVKQLDSRKAHLSETEVLTVGSICGEIAQAIGYEDPDFDRAPSDAAMAGQSQGYFGWFSQKLGLRLRR
jgi:hypothetical protein